MPHPTVHYHCHWHRVTSRLWWIPPVLSVRAQTAKSVVHINGKVLRRATENRPNVSVLIALLERLFPQNRQGILVWNDYHFKQELFLLAPEKLHQDAPSSHDTLTKSFFHS